MQFAATKNDILIMKSEMKRFIKIQSIVAELVSLKARYEAATVYCQKESHGGLVTDININSMVVESTLLEAQIKALEEKLKHLKRN